MALKIKKASGIIEDFNSQKLHESLMRSGAEQDQADEIVEKIMSEIAPFTSTKKIYRLAHKYLRRYSRVSGLRYSLKRGLLRLGPSGYPFEKYFGELMKHYGYQVTVGIMLEGKCVKHEVDVLAVNEREVVCVECKYRNNAGDAPDVKTVLYVHSRFQDLRPSMKAQYPGRSFSGLLVTNSRFTSDAIQYAKCANLQIKSWGHPQSSSLEKMIEDKKLYPVTILSILNSYQIKKLIEHRVILMKDLAAMKVQDIRKMLSVPEGKALALTQQANELCYCDR